MEILVPLRPANDLEHRLYLELTEPIAAWVAQNPGKPAPRHVMKTWEAIRMKVMHLGMHPTPQGLFMTYEADILEGEHPEETIDYVNRMWMEAWLQTTGQMRRRDAFFQ